MVHLLSVNDAFHARVIAARLGSDGILTELRGPVGGPYPLPGEVKVYVEADALLTARELLLADQVESAFDERDGGARTGRGMAVPAWIVVVSLVLISLLYLSHLTRGV